MWENLPEKVLEGMKNACDTAPAARQNWGGTKKKVDEIPKR